MAPFLQQFEKLDLDRSGVLTKADLKQMVQRHQQNFQEANPEVAREFMLSVQLKRRLVNRVSIAKLATAVEESQQSGRHLSSKVSPELDVPQETCSESGETRAEVVQERMPASVQQTLQVNGGEAGAVVVDELKE